MESLSNELLSQARPNRNFKDSLFRDLFGNPRYKQNALELYNTLLGTSHTDPEGIDLSTIEGTLYLGYRNDVSFILDESMMLWEHQSTVSQNMPLRGLLYLTLLISQHLKKTGQSELSSKLVRLPTPRYFVFYNGTDPMPERSVLHLSDAFANGLGDIEVTATVLNINEGHNSVIMDACEALRGYAHIVALYRENMKRMPPREAMDSAVDACIEDNLLVSYLRERRSEVVDMIMTEWKEKEYRELLQREAREDGYDEGRLEGTKETRDEFLKRTAQAVRKGLVSLPDAAAQFGFTEEELRAAL